MSKTVLEAAALVGVVIAAIAGSLYALGTVAYLGRLDALGFDAHQFPPLGAELHVTGTVYARLPALLIAVVASVYAIMFALANRLGTWFSHDTSAWLRIPIAVALGLLGAGMVLFTPATPMQWGGAGIIVVTLMLAVGLSGKWVAPALSSFCAGVLMLFLAILIVSARAQEDGRSLAREAGKSNATTIIERIDGSKTPLPGRRIVCSERFCGFHDGKTATVISLEGVQSIQSSHPQKPPPQPDVRRSLWDRMRGK